MPGSGRRACTEGRSPLTRRSVCPVKLPSIPGPGDVLAAVEGLREGIGDALALVPRLGAVVGRVEQLVERISTLVDRAEVSWTAPTRR